MIMFQVGPLKPLEGSIDFTPIRMDRGDSVRVD